MKPTRDIKPCDCEKRVRSRGEHESGVPETSSGSPLDVPAVRTRLKKGELVAIVRAGRERG